MFVSDISGCAWPLSIRMAGGRTDDRGKPVRKYAGKTGDYQQVDAMMKHLGGFQYTTKSGTDRAADDDDNPDQYRDVDIATLTQSREHLLTKKFHILVEVTDVEGRHPVYGIEYTDSGEDVLDKVLVGCPPKIRQGDMIGAVTWLQGDNTGPGESVFGEYIQEALVNMQEPLMRVTFASST